MKAHLKVGDRVEQPDVVVATSHGVVERADDYCVLVRWDDGMTGLLYYDNNMLPNARKLIRLSK
jgi:hypothetical protein